MYVYREVQSTLSISHGWDELSLVSLLSVGVHTPSPINIKEHLEITVI